MKKTTFLCILIATLLLPTATQVMAQEEGNIHVGKLKIAPGITIQAIHDDNIYSGNGTNNTGELEESDLITHVVPKILLELPFAGKRGSTTLGYQADLAYYGQNEDNNWQTHKINFGLDYQAPGGLIFGINNTYTNAEDPYGGLNEYKLGQPQTDRWSDDLNTEIGFKFSDKFKLMGYYNFYKQDYDLVADYTQDYYDNEFGAGFEMKLFPKTWGFIRYHYGDREYFTHPAGTGSLEGNDSDYDWSRVNTGLTWDSGAKLSGELNFGYQWKDYDNALDSVGAVYEDKNTWIASTDVSYKVTSSTNLSLSITRALTESGSNTNEFYEGTGFGITLQQKIIEKIALTAGINYSNNDYNLPINTPKEDDDYGANIDIEYTFVKWLKAGLGYSYSEKDSNYIENEYTDNQFVFSVNAVF